MSVHDTVLFASFDPDHFQDPESFFYNIQDTVDRFSLNYIPNTINFQISSNPYGKIISADDTIMFTTNGILGLGTPTSAFEIPQINFVNQDIYFTATVTTLVSAGDDRLASSSSFVVSSFVPRKNSDKLEEVLDLLITHDQNETFIVDSESDGLISKISQIKASLVLQDGTVLPSASADFKTNFGPLSSDFAGGYIKGKIKSGLSAENCKILLEYNTETLNLSGYSPTFNIYPNKGYFNPFLVGEDHNQKKGYKDLIFQEILNEQNGFFDDLLGQIVGDNLSDPNTIGKKVYSKIRNYVSNVSDVEYTDLNSLKSLINELGIKYEQYQQAFPPSLNRIMDIISVSLSLQKGGTNQYQDNFDDRGFTGKSVYGKNKGYPLDIENTILQTGANSQNIIAYEKFSEKYKLVNTNVISASDISYLSATTAGVSAYSLSSFNNSWGWGLVLPNNVEGIDVKDYYQFYQFVPGVEDTYLQKFIDFDNPQNTYLNPITSIPWEGNYKTTNPPGGPPWILDGTNTGITLLNSQSSTFYNFQDKDYSVSIETDFGLAPGVAKSIIGAWTPTDHKRSWIVVRGSDGGLGVQFSSNGVDHDSTEFVLASSIPPGVAEFRYEKVGTTVNYYFNGLKVPDEEVYTFGTTPEVLPSTNTPVRVGYLSTNDDGSIKETTYNWPGTINRLIITEGIGVSGRDLINVDSGTNTVFPVTAYNQYSDKFGIAENVISHNLYSNLGLLSG